MSDVAPEVLHWLCQKCALAPDDGTDQTLDQGCANDGQLHRRQAVLSQVSHARTAVGGRDDTGAASWSSMAVHSSDVAECASLYWHTAYIPCAGTMPVEQDTTGLTGTPHAQAHVCYPA